MAQISTRSMVLHLAIAAALIATSSASAEILRENDAIWVLGTIAEDEDERFAVLLDGGVKMVITASKGGSVRAATSIAIMIRTGKLATVVPRGMDCSSACTVAWSAGRPRTLSVGSYLGIHCARYSTEPTGCSEGANNIMFNALLRAGAPPELIAAQERMEERVTWFSELAEQSEKIRKRDEYATKLYAKYLAVRHAWWGRQPPTIDYTDEEIRDQKWRVWRHLRASGALNRSEQ